MRGDLIDAVHGGDSFDVVVVGGGHNGLVAGGYLARAGLRVAIVEARTVVGGAAATEELIPGFRFSSAAVVLSLLWPKIVRELELRRHGLDYYKTPVDRIGIWENGRVLVLYPELDRQLRALEAFSRRDAIGLVRLGAEIRRFAALYEPTALQPPPSFEAFRTLFAGADERLFERIVLGSIRALLEPYFASPELLGFYGFPGMVSVDAGPDTPGTAYVYGHHAVGGLEGSLGSHGFVRGGMGGLSDALARSAQAAGATLELGTPVERILVEDGAAAGVRLADGRELAARTVVSNADARRTMLDLVGRGQLDPAFASQVEAIDYSGTMARVYLAVSELPRYEAAPHEGPGPAAVHRAFALLGADLERFQRAHEAQSAGRIPEEPVLEISIQSTDDPTLTPSGAHGLNLGVMHVPWTLADGTWDDHRERLGDIVVERLCSFAPNLRNAIVGRRVATPLDWQRTYGLPEGNIFHGAMGPGRILGSRPLPGWASYRMPVRGLYLCGSGTHPGGAVSGAPGHNAAHEAIRDLRDGPLGADEWLARAHSDGPLPPRTRRGRALARTARTRPGAATLYALARMPALRPAVARVLTTRTDRP
jgi:phytoene dehydrogenase-like protein